MTNIADLLRNAKKGTILWSPLFGPVEFMQLGKNDQIWVRIDNSEPFDKYGRYFGSRFPEAECQLFPSKDYRTWQGWTPCVEPKFKVGTWLWHKEKGVFPMMVEDYDEKEGYLMQFTDETKCYFGRDIIENDYRLWEISDAKEGDVLAVDWNEKNGHVKNKWEKIVIFKSINKVGVEGYGCTFKNNKLAFDTDVPYYSTTWTHTLKPASKKQRDLLFQKIKEAGYQWDADKKELSKIKLPNFKTGDWIITDKNHVWLVDKDCSTTGYLYRLIAPHGKVEVGEYEAVDAHSRLWTIQDAKDGDVLVLNGFSKEYKWIGIFKAHTSDTSFSSHCHYNCGMCEFVTDIARCTKHGIKYNDIHPATNEERDLLFAKMQEAGYQWDADKKELKGFPKHYDISNFHEGMPVLVRDSNNDEWNYLLFSHYRKKMPDHFFAGGYPWYECIPFEGNETLLGTTDMCNERFINW